MITAVNGLKSLLTGAGLDFHDLVELLKKDDQENLADLFERFLEKEPDILVRLARANATFFRGPKGIAFAEVHSKGRTQTLALKSEAFSEWLIQQYFVERNRAPKKASESDAIRTLAAYTRAEGGRCEVYLRSGLLGSSSLYLDLGDERGQCVEITPRGWTVLPSSPVKFRRMPTTGTLPLPERGGDIQSLRPFVNLNDDDFILFVAALLDALIPNRPHVVLNFVGDSGSAKTTIVKIARKLADPAGDDVEASTLPCDERDLFADVYGSSVLFYDNVGDIPKKISDALCQITSGTGYRRRKLYTNLDQVSVGGYRMVVLTSLHNTITEPDLAERALTMNLVPIVPKVRRSDVEFWSEFEQARPAIFGALLDVIALGLRRLPTTKISNLPRLADFVLFGTACETALAPAGSFLRAFTASQLTATSEVIEVDPLATAIETFMERRIAWDGTSTQLLKELQRRDRSEARPTEARSFPKEPIALGIALGKVAGTLRKVGVELTRDRTKGHKREKIIHLRRVEVPSPEQQASSSDGRQSDGSDGSDGSIRVAPGAALKPPRAKKPDDFNTVVRRLEARKDR